MVNRTLSLEPRGELPDVLLRAFNECLGVGLKSAFTSVFEISANVGDNGVRIVQALVNTSEKKVDITISLSRVDTDCIEGAAFGFGDLVKRELDESETVFADGGRRCDEKTFLNERFGFEEFGALVENHG